MPHIKRRKLIASSSDQHTPRRRHRHFNTPIFDTNVRTYSYLIVDNQFWRKFIFKKYFTLKFKNNRYKYKHAHTNSYAFATNTYANFRSLSRPKFTNGYFQRSPHGGRHFIDRQNWNVRGEEKTAQTKHEKQFLIDVMEKRFVRISSRRMRNILPTFQKNKSEK